MTLQRLPSIIKPNPSLYKEFAGSEDLHVSACYQCEKCTNGCPVTFAMDIMPHRVIRLLHLGQLDKVLHSDTIWVCASCETCTTRCPNDIDVAHVMDKLRQRSGSDKSRSVLQEDARLFHNEFLSLVRKYGRVHELELVTRYTVASKGLAGYFKQAAIGLNLLLKGKLKPMPHSLFGNRQVQAIFKEAEEKAK